MNDSVKELEQHYKDAVAAMKRIITGMGDGTHTRDDAVAAIRATCEAGRVYQIALTVAQSAATEQAMIANLDAELVKADTEAAVILERGRLCDPRDN